MRGEGEGMAWVEVGFVINEKRKPCRSIAPFDRGSITYARSVDASRPYPDKPNSPHNGQLTDEALDNNGLVSRGRGRGQRRGVASRRRRRRGGGAEGVTRRTRARSAAADRRGCRAGCLRRRGRLGRARGRFGTVPGFSLDRRRDRVGFQALLALDQAQFPRVSGPSVRVGSARSLGG